MEIEFEHMVNGNPVIALLAFMEDGEKFDVVDIPATEKKYYYNRNGERVRDDG